MTQTTRLRCQAVLQKLVGYETCTLALEAGFSTIDRAPFTCRVRAIGRDFINQNKAPTLAGCTNVFHLYPPLDAIGTFPHLSGLLSVLFATSRSHPYNITCWYPCQYH